MKKNTHHKESYMTRPRLEYENDKPVLVFEINGMPIEMHFLEKEPEHNAKETVLGILTDSYKNKVLDASEKNE